MLLTEHVRRYLDKQDPDSLLSMHYIVALSGGKDSVSLLSVMKELQSSYGYGLLAVHIEHGIRKEAMEDAAFCEELCATLGIPLRVFHVKAKDLAEAEGLSIEDAARRERYACFEKAVASVKDGIETKEVRVLLAHHAKDQAETVLLHLLRGTGLKGLGGMKEERDVYVRPILDASEEEILSYIEENGLSYVQDQTNFDHSYTRNRIRGELIPHLEKEYNPEIVSGLVRMAKRLQEEDDLLEKITEEYFPNLRDDQGRVKANLDLRGFEMIPKALQRRGLRLWLDGNGLLKDVEEEHIEALIDLAKGRTGRSVSLPRDLTVSKSYDILYFTCFSAKVQKECGFEGDLPIKFEVLSREEFDQSITKIPDLPFEKWMDADKAGEDLSLRTRKEGDYLLIRRKTENGFTLGKQKLQDLFINEKVPREQRKTAKLLANGSHILWVVGVRMSDGVRITPETKRVLHVTLESGLKIAEEAK